MLYIHRFSCISPQSTYGGVSLLECTEYRGNKLRALEPPYPFIPAGSLRRMGKAVRMGIGAAIPLMQSSEQMNGIILGTANGGMEDCIRFLNQIVQYEEGLLTPGNFVQSTPNAIASQISLIQRDHAYNITHVHRGHSFENALLDASLQVKENPSSFFLVGAVDEISTYNFNIEELGGWYKPEGISTMDLYRDQRPGSIAGEGASMFRVSGRPKGALARLEGPSLFTSKEDKKIEREIISFLDKQGPEPGIDLLISGENGDSRLLPQYLLCEKLVGKDIPVARFKHMFGEFPTASAMGLWMACVILQQQTLPLCALKEKEISRSIEKILLYNNYKGIQHSLMLVSRVDQVS